MRSLLEGLPPEVAKRIHPDWQKNEAEYWAQRDTLLPHYRDQWIGFANGHVIVSGTSPVEVLHSAQASGQHPFVTCVGHEHEPNRMRRVSFSYDTTKVRQSGDSLPLSIGLQVGEEVTEDPRSVAQDKAGEFDSASAAEQEAKENHKGEDSPVILRRARKLKVPYLRRTESQGAKRECL